MADLSSVRSDISKQSAVQRAILSAALLALILVTVTIVYAPTLHDAFHGDDFVAFTEFKLKNFYHYSKDVFLFKSANFYWRPLGNIFHYSMYSIFGFSPFAFRVAALAIFLATLVCMYFFCLGERLGHVVALVAVLIFGLYPNHVVSVTWVTNTSRLTAGLFVMISLLLLQQTASRRDHHVLWEVLSFLAFVIAVLNDETTTALAPMLLFYASFVVRRDFHWKSGLCRLAAYALLACVIIPLQFTYTINDEARLTQYGVGPHVLTSAWALASQLSLPLGTGSPVEVYIQTMPATEWAAGMVTLAACGILFILGSRHTRFVVVWIAVALAPFALWEPQNISPRYVYLAAMPFAILVAWACSKLAFMLIDLEQRSWQRLRLEAFAALAALVIVPLLCVPWMRADRERNAAWSHETEKYGVLREALEKDVSQVSPGTRMIVFYGDWPDFWASAVARSIYGDRSLWITSIPREKVDQAQVSVGPNDLVAYLLRDRLLPVDSRR